MSGRGLGDLPHRQAERLRRHLAPRAQPARDWLTDLVAAAMRFEAQTGGRAADLLAKGADRHVDEQAAVYEAKRLRELGRASAQRRSSER